MIAYKKAKQVLEAFEEPTARARFLVSPVVVLKSVLFDVPHVVYMRFNDFENLEELSVPEGHYIRTYHEGDEAIWTQMVNRSFSRLYPCSMNEIRKSSHFDPDALFFLMHNNRAVGTVYAEHKQNGKSELGLITALCVVPEYQGRKLGRFLLLYALHNFKSKGFKSVFLDVDQFNAPAIKTYLSLGFKYVGK